MNARVMGVAAAQTRMGWRDNWLAFLLSREFCSRNAAFLQPVVLGEKEILIEAGSFPSHVYFPISCGTVQLSELENGASTAVSMTGFDGMVNIELLFGASEVMWTSVVLNRGSAVKLPLKELRDELNDNAEFRAAAMKCLHYRMFQMGQMAACYQHHSIEQEISRWMLMVHDYVCGDDIHVTHQIIATQLGLRREAVTMAALALQEQDLIKNVRGNITVLDRLGLEAHSCECYRGIDRERSRLRPKESGAPLSANHLASVRAA